MELYTKTEVKQFLLEMAKRCRKDMELPLNVYLENVSKNIDEITYIHPLEDDVPPTSQYFPTSSQTENGSKGSDSHELDDDIPPTSQYFCTLCGREKILHK